MEFSRIIISVKMLYNFQGDLEQMTIVPDSNLVSLQCSPTKTPIIDASLETSSIENQENTVTVPSKELPSAILKKKHSHHTKSHHKKKKFGTTKKELTDFE